MNHGYSISTGKMKLFRHLHAMLHTHKSLDQDHPKQQKQVIVFGCLVKSREQFMNYGITRTDGYKKKKFS